MWVRSADAKDKAGLQRLESRLSMEEIAHFRAFVAARSSKVLTKSELHLQHAVDAVDAVVANLGVLCLSIIRLCIWCQYCDPPPPGGPPPPPRPPRPAGGGGGGGRKQNPNRKVFFFK